jgi:hypothetical protein
MAHDILSSARVRKRRWRARKRLEKLEAEKAAKAAHRAELDAARIARGLLPIAEARREKVRKFREKQARMKDFVAQCWFGPEIDMETATQARIAQCPNLDPSISRSFVESQARSCAANYLNLNALVLKRGFHIACHARTIFHELVESGVPLTEAAQRCHKEVFKPDPSLSGVQQALDTCRRFDEARDKWGTGETIANARLGRKVETDVVTGEPPRREKQQPSI